nr:hypothetical protein [Tanacetum cinerariifolium]
MNLPDHSLVSAKSNSYLKDHFIHNNLYLVYSVWLCLVIGNSCLAFGYKDLLVITHSVHAVDTVVSGIAIARIFLCPGLIKASHQALIPPVEAIDNRIYYLRLRLLPHRVISKCSNQYNLHSSGIVFLQQWELSSPVVVTSSDSGNSITGSGNALCILFPTLYA